MLLSGEPKIYVKVAESYSAAVEPLLKLTRPTAAKTASSEKSKNDKKKQ